MVKYQYLIVKYQHLIVKYQHLIVECVMYVMLVVLTLIPRHRYHVLSLKHDSLARIRAYLVQVDQLLVLWCITVCIHFYKFDVINSMYIFY